MKNIFNKMILLTAMTCSIACIVLANSRNESNRYESNVMTKTETDKLIASLDKNVELRFGTDGNVYSRSQAKAILQDYFRKNQPIGFVTSHVSKTETRDMETTIGNIHTATGVINVTILAKLSPGSSKKQIVQMSFD